VTHCEDPDNPCGGIDGVHDAEAPHAILPESLQFPQKRFPEGGITPESLKGSLDGTLQVWGKMPNDLTDMGWDVEAIRGH
jgi:hypothetical protein